MVNNIEELKKLIIWAKEQKLKSLKLADIHIEISDLALVESLSTEVTQLNTEQNIELNEKIKVQEQASAKKQDDEDLYWSSN